MKRLYLIIALILLLIIDNTLLPYYSIYGAFPSLLFTFAMAYSIIRGKEEAIFIGVVSGFLQDIFFFSGFGVNLFLNMLLCLLCAKIGESIFKENRLVPVLTALGISGLKVLGVVIIFKLFSQTINIQVALISCVLNSICMMIFYTLILKILDKYLERNTWRFK
ncbi:rod shape-determining protein MreD [Clostridium sp. D53t1_180928_C8]|uniref:rod shape-determining protein MreD n=1 Tax=Clostridium sp. D53t1_180928_C8 TaxID=2787101 RepID=UPI0018AB3EFC|nr:rod shape-determining protein MreD [Clostridium sp. D53t1_180928_C8]